jgi:hypothetical protein
MKKNLFRCLVTLVIIQLIFAEGSFAQKTGTKQSGAGSDYETAFGLRVEVGSKYGTWVGPSIKHFFNDNDVAEGTLLFAPNNIILGAEYQYHGDVANAPGLKWYIGFGAAYAFGTNNTESDALIRPVFGLDYKITDVPINFTFDWRPAFVVTHGTDFNAARFGFALRFAF